MATAAFGHFKVVTHRRELLADGKAPSLGGRAFDVRITLIEVRKAIVSKDGLMACVRPNRVVDESALHVQNSPLRATLGPDRRLSRTVAGRGHQFTGELRPLPAIDDEHVHISNDQAGVPPANLPEPVSKLIGRDEGPQEIMDIDAAHRLAMLTSAGEAGKTRLAVAVRRRRRLADRGGGPLCAEANEPPPTGAVLQFTVPTHRDSSAARSARLEWPLLATRN